MLTKVQKQEQVTGLSDRFVRAKAAFLVDFKGLNVEQVTDLRKKLRTDQSEIKVYKNTLIKRALKDHPEMEEFFQESLVGPNAVVFSYENPSVSAKIISKFGKEFGALKIKLGYMDGKGLGLNEVKSLASLPSKEELRSMLLGTLQAPMSQFVRLLNAVPTSFVRALSEKQKLGGSL